MTDKEKAIAFLVETKLGCKKLRYKQLSNVCDISIKAIEKQLPKKPIPDNRYFSNSICPSCKATFMDKSTKYCGNCGQALDWSDEEC